MWREFWAKILIKSAVVFASIWYVIMWFAEYFASWFLKICSDLFETSCFSQKNLIQLITDQSIVSNKKGKNLSNSCKLPPSADQVLNRHLGSALPNHIPHPRNTISRNKRFGFLVKPSQTTYLTTCTSIARNVFLLY